MSKHSFCSIPIALLGLASVVLSGCSTSATPNPEVELAELRMFQAPDSAGPSGDTWQERDPDELAPGFTISIGNPHDPSLNGRFQIDSRGVLKLPYDQEVRAEGMTVEELKKELSSRYARYLRSPAFRVSVEQRDYFVEVRGLVKEPGTYLVTSESSLDELIAKAGGLELNERNDRVARYVRINQLGVTRIVNLQDYFSGGAPGLIPRWQGGETVFFQTEGPAKFSHDRDYIQVLGQVSSPGAYPYRPNADFVSYLTLAGGPTDRADLSRITLLKRSHGQTVSRQDLELDDVSAFPEIQPGDTVIVNSSNPTQLERRGTLAASFAAVLSAIGLVIIAL